jgi:dimethylhistidine N-methyltransferase
MSEPGSARRARTSKIAVHDAGWEELSFLDAVAEGLSRAQKAIPCAFLYDERGSHLFDRICTLPEYYQTRTETAILRAHSDEIAAAIGPRATLYELGSGSSKKTPVVLDALASPAAYVPIDVSRAHLIAASEAIANRYPALRIEAVCGDYAAPHLLPALDPPARSAAFFPGSTIGNLTREDAIALLKAWRAQLGADGVMVVGVDLKKDPQIIERAYNDAAGVTAAFIRNILAHANRALRADFDLDAFDYEGRYVEERGRVEMFLVSTRAQSVRVGGKRFAFAAGEKLHVENSQKYGREEFADLAERAGFAVRTCLSDRNTLFSVQILG